MPSLRSRWHRWWLHNHIPLIGGFLRRRAAVALSKRIDGLLPLLEALDSYRETVREAAGDALSNLEAGEILEELCHLWASDRNPSLEKVILNGKLVATSFPEHVLTALKTERREELRDLQPFHVEHLLSALTDRDEQIVGEARLLLHELERDDTRVSFNNLLGQRWLQTRDARLEALIVTGQHLADEPGSAFLATRLKSGRLEDFNDPDHDTIERLLDACEDHDSDIATNAFTALTEVSSANALDQFCQRFLHQQSEAFGPILVAQNYTPKVDSDRALFLFLTEQWERYDILDFDRRFLLGIYQSADEKQRQRIIKKLRASGRSDFLTILAGREYRSRLAQIAPDEAEVLIQMLSANEEWPRLWQLVFDLRLMTSMWIMRRLMLTEWRPERADELAMFDQLAEIAGTFDMVENRFQGLTPEMLQEMPVMAQRATVRVAGHVNDVAFSPHRPLITVGTGKRRVIVWNFHTAEQEEEEKRLPRSVSHVLYAPDDSLIAIEFAHSKQSCSLHLWRNDEHHRINIRRKVTSVVPLSDEGVILTTRHQYVYFFDTRTRTITRERRFPFWTRQIRASPSGGRLALLRQGITLIRSSDFETIASTSGQYVLSAATFTTNSDELVVSQREGEIYRSRRASQWMATEPSTLLNHSAKVESLEMVSKGRALLSASVDGEVRFTSWFDLKPLGSVQVPGDRLKSLRISPDGLFVAIGNSDQTMTLWDLRPLETQTCLSHPFAQALPVQLAGLSALVDAENLSDEMQRAVRYAQLILRHRFRFDIEIAETTQIRRGEYDIEID